AEINVESESGEGSKFTIYFPLLEEKPDEIMMVNDSKYNALIIENEYIRAYKLVENLSLLNISTDVEFLKDQIIEKLYNKCYDFVISCHDPDDIENIVLFTKLKNEFPEVSFILVV